MTSSKKGIVQFAKPSRKSNLSAGFKPLSGSYFAQSERSTTERVAEAFASASKKTGTFETRYAKK